MKPVIVESTIAKLKGIIDSATGDEKGEMKVDEAINDLEAEIIAFDDNRENVIFLYGAISLVVVLASVLIYTHGASWPLGFVVLSSGALLYYQVTERAQVTDNLILKGRVSSVSPLTKIDYLVGEIDLKIARKKVLKIYLSIVLSSAVMMAHHLFVDSSVGINMFLLVGAMIASYFFWNHLYKVDVTALSAVRDELSATKSTLILGRRYDF